LVKVTARIWPGPGLAGGQDVGEPGGEDAGLAGAGPGQHQQRALDRLDRGALLGVEALEIRRFDLLHGARGEAARPRRRGGLVAEIVEVERFAVHSLGPNPPAYIATGAGGWNEKRNFFAAPRTPGQRAETL
jgi:hypothetical protein